MFRLTRTIRGANPTVRRLFSTDKDSVVSGNKSNVTKSFSNPVEQTGNSFLATAGLIIGGVVAYGYYHDYAREQRCKKERTDREEADRKAKQEEETRLQEVVTHIKPITKQSLKGYNDKLHLVDVAITKEDLYKVDIEKMAVKAVENRGTTFKLYLNNNNVDTVESWDYDTINTQEKKKNRCEIFKNMVPDYRQHLKTQGIDLDLVYEDDRLTQKSNVLTKCWYKISF